jgi:2-isopropylmalate synthase
MPYSRYRPAASRVDVPRTVRSWPDRTLTAAPLWVSVDLRDGNQALAEPMDPDRKSALFSLLVAIGFKEIEIGYPSASQADFDFARRLCVDPQIPDDVTISVFTPARPELIDRTFQAMQGVRNGLIHLCVPTAPMWRSAVLGASRAEVLQMVLRAADQVLRRADTSVKAAGGSMRFEFSPEVFNLTEPDYVLEVCNRVTERWDACDDRPVVHNLPATVEVAMPNVYADQIEFMHRNLARRRQVILSVHPHNDRGTGVAAAELAMLAGAQRVEGCLLGNGERTGNVDLVTLALNVFSQGVDPMIDLSAIDQVRRTVEYCTRLPVHPRHPYAGDLVYTAFSGTHQDAIRKGLARRQVDAEASQYWDVPYLPIDPADVGRTYAAVIRVNSQSGKGGVAYVLESQYGVSLPRAVQVEFSPAVQAVSDTSGTELTGSQLWTLFASEYMPGNGAVITELRIEREAGQYVLSAQLVFDDVRPIRSSGRGADLVTAAADLLSRADVAVGIVSCDLQASLLPAGSRHACFVEGSRANLIRWGAGLGDTPAEAILRAIISASVRIDATDGPGTTVPMPPYQPSLRVQRIPAQA